MIQTDSELPLGGSFGLTPDGMKLDRGRRIELIRSHETRLKVPGVRIWHFSSLLPKTTYIIKFLLRFDRTLAASGNDHKKLHMSGTVGRAKVPADIGRHGGRPSDGRR